VSIRVVKKEPDLPPARLYLEDIAEIVGLMRKDAESVFKDSNPDVRFVVGNRECDSIADLESIGGSSRNFEVSVGYQRFRVSSIGASAPSGIFDPVFRLMNARRIKARGFLREVPWLVWTTWYVALIVFANATEDHASKRMIFLILLGFVLPGALITWTHFAHSVVELRYSHTRSPKRKLITEWGSKAAWIVLGVFLTGAAQLCWHYFFGK